MFYGVYIFPFAQAAREETRDVPLTHRVFRGTSRSPSSKRCPTFACNVPKGVWSDQAIEKALQGLHCREDDSVKEVRAVVGAIMASKNSLDCAVVSHGWWDRFRSRHPHLTLRMGETLAYRRAVGLDRVVIDNYFDLLAEVLESNDLTTRPHLVFNAEETGLPLQHRAGKRVAIRGQKHIHQHVINSGNKAQVTVLACANAAGYAIPPMIIFQRKNLTTQLTAKEVPGSIYGLSDSGWMDSELFGEWFHRHFLNYAPSARPLLLLLDGHSSHYNLEFIRQASSEGVVVFCLPPNTTHVSTSGCNSISLPQDVLGSRM